MLGISPEGACSPMGALIEGKNAAMYSAANMGIPIIPVAITGTV